MNQRQSVQICRRSAIASSLLLAACSSKRRAQDRHTPVLLLHGMFADHRAMDPLQSYLQRDGFAHTHAPDLSPVDGSHSITLLAEQLDTHARALLRRTGSAKLDVVGYSLGAIVARYWLLRQGGTALTRRFVSLAGPQQGVVGGMLSTATVAEELRPLSPFLVSLESHGHAWGGVQVASFLSPFDAVILPPETAIVPGSNIVHVFLAPSHHHMATDAHVLRAVAGVLSSTPMTLPPDLPTPRELSLSLRRAIERHRIPAF